MLFPTIVADNFFSNPNEIVTFSKTLKYVKDKNGTWPGERSLPLHTINEDFFKFVSFKTLSILYPNEWKNINFNATYHFQKINMNDYDKGWIHKDVSVITSIVYLSDHKNCGTSIYDRKENMFKTDSINLQEKESFYKDIKDLKKRKNALNKAEENNNLFNETIKINSKFNRILIFDSNSFHGVNNFENSLEERLTLIGFFTSINNIFDNLKYPLNENKFIY